VGFRARGPGWVSLVTLGACNALTGVNDLHETDDAGPDALTPADAAGGADAAGAGERAAEGAVDGPLDISGETGADACAPSSPTVVLGSAQDHGTYVDLTALAVTLAGGIASATEVPLDRFTAAFDFSVLAHLGIGSTTPPAAGVTFFALAAPAPTLHCAPGPNICVLGSAAGFAVLLRTAQGAAGDPDAPYIAVLDAPSFPANQPVGPVPVPAASFETDVGNTDPNGPPPATSWHTMTIRATNGVVDVALDGRPLLTGVAIPGYTPGFVGTWGIGASTGQLSGAERNTVRNVVLRGCVP
jgi:hypothetical protein